MYMPLLFDETDMLLKSFFLRSKEYRELKVSSVQVFWARLTSYDQLGLVSKPLMVLKFHNRTQSDFSQ